MVVNGEVMMATVWIEMKVVMVMIMINPFNTNDFVENLQ